MSDARDLIRSRGFTVLGLAGRAKAGKSTFAAAAGSCHPLHMRLGFADCGRSVSLAIFGSAYRSQDEKDAADPYWAELLGEEWATGRKILEGIGRMIRGVHADLPVMVSERRMLEVASLPKDHPMPFITFEDVRFNGEAQFIKEIGGTVIRMIRADQKPQKNPNEFEKGISNDLVDQEYICDSADAVEGVARAYMACLTGVMK